MTASLLDLSAWTHERVHAECRASYQSYSRSLDRHYADYFASHPEESGVHPRQASDLERALPPGFEHLADRLPVEVRHRHHLSGRSSQVLAVSVLGASAALDFSHDWLFAALTPLPATDSPLLEPRFEHELPPEALNEHPRVTTIDYLVQTQQAGRLPGSQAW